MIMTGLGPEALAARDAARAFGATLSPNRAERDQRGARDAADWREDWRACAAHGLLGMRMPQSLGGHGADLITTIAALEGLGQGCDDHGLTLGLNGQLWAVMEPILAFGSEAQKATYLPRLMDGSWIGAHGLTEPETGSNAMALKTTATALPGGYRLNGRKTYVGLGPACDLALVFASTRPEAKQWGISAFLVEATDPGFTRADPQQKLGLRTVPMGELFLEDCFVPEDRRLSVEGAGMGIFQHTMIWERSFIFASHVGAMDAQLAQATQFARNRRVFDGPISDQQSVSNRLADMKLRHTTSQLMLYRAAGLLAEGETAMAHAAATKLHISEAFVASSFDAIRIHGGLGYLEGQGVEHALRDALGGVIYSGTSDIQRNILAALL